MVILDMEKKYKKIKACLDGMGIPSQFMLRNTVKRAKITVYTNILKQMNSKVGLDLYQIDVGKVMEKTM